MNKYLKQIILISSLLFFISQRNELVNHIKFKPVANKNLNNAKIVKKENNILAYAISDLTYQKESSRFLSDMVLSFNYNSDDLRRDDSNNYIIKYSRYNYLKGNGALGQGCAWFFKQNHKVEIKTVKNLWLGSCDDLGSFNIEFRFAPHSLKDGSILFSRIGYFSGKKIGIVISLNNNRTTARLYSMFMAPDGQKVDVFLNRGNLVPLNKWTHFSLSFNRISGKLSKYHNGAEEETVYLTDDGSPHNGVFVPMFSEELGNKKKCLDLPIVSIGDNFAGYIDEFRITHKHFDGLESEIDVSYRDYKSVTTKDRTPSNHEGIITSPVHTFPDSGTKVISFYWNEELTHDNYIWMEFRTSDNLFYEGDKDPKWYRIKNKQRSIYLKKTSSGDYLRGKYYQWRAHLVSSPDGTSTPFLSDIGLSYLVDYAPQPPKALEIVKIGDETVHLRWEKNVDSDLLGYRIYYGISPGKYDGILFSVNNSRINNDISSHDFVDIKITNSLIEENRNLDKKKVLTYPKLKNTVLYYFAVSAYDSYKPGTPHNHESPLSPQVSARPYAGSEID